MAVAELKEISKSVQGMNAATGQFKQAAADNNRNVSKVIKDLSSVFTSQKKDISGLGNAIQESLHESQQTSGKIDNTNSLLQESISIQNLMYSQLRNVNSGIEKLNNILLNNMPGQQAGGGATPPSGGGGNVAAALLAGGLGGGAITAASSMASGNAKGVGETGSSSEAMQFFQSKGWSKEQSAGIVGNLQAESGANLKTNAIGDGGKAYGIAQWHPDRQENFKKVFGKNIREAGFKEQLEFINWELNNSEKAAGNQLRQTKSAEEAAAVVDKKYERSSGAHIRQRIANANKLAGDDSSTASRSSQSQSSAASSATKQESSQATNSEKLKDQVDKTFKLGGGMTGNIGNVERLSPDLQTALSKALAEYQEKTGKMATITSGHRTTEEQEKVGATFGIKAKPGTSKHEKGNAVDVSSADAREMESMGILAKYGLHRPLGERDPVHIELKSGGAAGGESQRGEFGAPKEGARMMGGYPAMGGRMDMGAMNPLAQLGMMAGGLFGGAGGAAIGGLLGNLGGMAMSAMGGEQQTARLQPQTTVSPLVDKSMPADQTQRPEDVTAAQYFREDKLRSAKMLQEQAAAKEVAMTTTAVKKEEEAKAVSPPTAEAGQAPTMAMDYNADSDRSTHSWFADLQRSYSVELQNKTQFA